MITSNKTDSPDAVRGIFAFLGKNLLQATTLSDAALHVVTAADDLFGWDACYVETFDPARSRAQAVLVMDVVDGKRTDLPGWDDTDREALQTKSMQSAQDPQLFPPSNGLAWSARFLGESRHRPKSAMAVPVGRALAHGGQLSIQSYAAGAYTSDDLDLLQILGDLLGSTFQRIMSEDNSSPSSIGLAEENQLLRTLIDTLPDYLYIKDSEGRFVVGNAALLHSLGANSLQEVVGKDDSYFAPPELRDQYRADELEVMASGKPMINREEVVVEASGERVLVSTTKVPLRDAAGRVVGVVGVGHAPHPDVAPKDFRRGTAGETARKAGVAIATVSRAFNGSPAVADSTRQRIFAAAREVGYQPNVAARNLSRGKSDTVGFVLKAQHLRGEFYSEMLSGFQGSLRRKGLETLLSVVPENESPHAWIHRLISSGACGSLVAHYDVLQSLEADIIASFPLPVVVANYFPSGSDPFANLTTVGYDNQTGVKQAVRHLAALGHSQIAWMGGPEGNRDAAEREKGFRRGMEECGLPVHEDWMVACAWDADPSSAGLAIQQIFAARSSLPTAAVCACDAIAGGAVMGARKWGKSVPGDLSVTGFDDASWASIYSPPLTTVRHHGRDMGTAVGIALMARMDAPGRPRESILLPASLIVRESTAPPPKTERLG